MDYFRFLPDEIIVEVFRQFLTNCKQLLSAYRNLHLVNHRWHSVCSSFADYLPKSEIVFDLVIVKSVTIISERSTYKCMNYNGSDESPSLFNMLRHYNRTEKFGSLIWDGGNCNDKLLLYLIENQLVNITNLQFHFCNMSGISEEVMISFFAAVADSKRCETLYIVGVKSAEFVITDRSLYPIITSGRLKNFNISSKNSSEFTSSLSDDTLFNLAKNLQQSFYNCGLSGAQQLTAHGILLFIEVDKSQPVLSQ
jgi:hypothetical protein